MNNEERIKHLSNMHRKTYADAYAEEGESASSVTLLRGHTTPARILVVASTGKLVFVGTLLNIVVQAKGSDLQEMVTWLSDLRPEAIVVLAGESTAFDSGVAAAELDLEDERPGSALVEASKVESAASEEEVRALLGEGYIPDPGRRVAPEIGRVVAESVIEVQAVCNQLVELWSTRQILEALVEARDAVEAAIDRHGREFVTSQSFGGLLVRILNECPQRTRVDAARTAQLKSQ